MKSPAVVRLLAAVRSEWLRPEETFGGEGEGREECPVDAVRASVASLPNPCLNSARAARGTSVRQCAAPGRSCCGCGARPSLDEAQAESSLSEEEASQLAYDELRALRQERRGAA